MTLADTSAWVAYLRGLPAVAADGIERLRLSGELATTEPVSLELLAGAKDAIERRRVRRALADATLLSVGGLDDWEKGAAVYRKCRAAGVTPRSQLDCLIAAVAIREEVPVLHADRDFDLIARHTPLRVARAD